MATYFIPNGPVLPSMDEVRAQAERYGGLAKSARFMVRFLPTRPDSLLRGQSYFLQELTYLCEAAEFPGRGFEAINLRYYGPDFKIPNKTEYEDLNLSFICRDGFFERQLFDTWMELINPNATYNFSYRDTYTCRIELFQISDLAGFGVDAATAPAAQYKFTFEDAYPILVQPQPVTWADDNFHRLTVTFTFKKWWREDGDFRINSDFDIVNRGDRVDNQGSGGIITPKFTI